MKVLANDGLCREGVDRFREAGIEIDTAKHTPEDLVAGIAGFDGLIVRSATRVTREVIEAGQERLKIIGRSGVGYDNVDTDAASEHGIVVKYSPHGNTNSTAELALALMMAVSRHIPQAHLNLAQGTWIKKAYEGAELSGKVLGIIGCGRIGRRLAQLVRGFDMKVIGYDPMPQPDSRIEYRAKEEVLKEADYISLHSGGGQQVIGEDELALMKPTAVLVNASRGTNVDEEALYTALTEGRIGGAGLDTYRDEPKKEGVPFDKAFRELNNIVLSSHLGASTREAQVKTGLEMANVVISFLKHADWRNAVNAGEAISVEEKETVPLFIVHQDIPGMFAQIDRILGEGQINIREISGRRFRNKDIATAVYLVEQVPTEDIVEKLRGIPGVYSIRH